MKTTKRLAQDVMKKIKLHNQKRKQALRFTGKTLALCALYALLIPALFHTRILSVPTSAPLRQDPPTTMEEQTEKDFHCENPFEEKVLQ